MRFSMSFDAILNEAKEYAEEVIRAERISFREEIDLENVPGVYMIYQGKEVIYIGQSVNLKKRFRKHLSDNQSTKGSTFRRILVKEFKIDPEDTRKHIEKFHVSFVEVKESNMLDVRVKTFDMCKLVESLLISHYRTIGRGLLNYPRSKESKNGA